ncbi:MAG: DUF6159 family protein [Phycisphaerales bacterium]
MVFRKSADLLKQSFNVLKQDKQLLIFPMLSSIACFAVMISFATPLIAYAIAKNVAANYGNHQLSAGFRGVGLVVSFLFYFVNYTVIVYFNTALVSCAIDRFEGREPTVARGMRAATALLPQILGWSLLSATVGMILRLIGERSGIIGNIVTALIGAGWTIATYFVVPVLVVEKVGPVNAVKRSVSVLSKTWGTALVSNIGLGIINFLLVIACLIPFGAGLAISIATSNWIAVVVGGVFTFVLLVLFTLITSAMQMILVAALYRFASGGVAPAGFDEGALRRAFAPKKTAVN